VIETHAKGLALLSLDGLSVGDAVGEHFLREYPRFNWNSEIPPGPLPWTDDTHMALSIVENLCQEGAINQDLLAARFAERFYQDPYRGYAGATYQFLSQINHGGDWRELTRARFKGGSFGNGSAMRAAPIGGFFNGDPERAAAQAALSSEVTHAHPEGIAGAVAVAVGAALSDPENHLTGREFIQEVLKYTPESQVADLMRDSLEIPSDNLPQAFKLGTGYQVTAQDTVPFCIWVAAHFGADYEGAVRTAMQGLGDCDTTCAIVGGIAALRSGEVPPDWLAAREALPELKLNSSD
jgi:ADP-ribosylglycohydrolase